MGRTIPSYRIAAEIERKRWRPFRLMLKRKDRKLYDSMLSLPRLYNSAGMMVCRPVVFHSVVMAILFHHYKQLHEMVKSVKDFQDGTNTDKIKDCQKCNRGVLEPTRNKKVLIRDNCGWAKIEMTMADYEELFKKQKMVEEGNGGIIIVDDKRKQAGCLH
ncbi:MAG TPA: hypothetical protein VF884_01445 [Nitrososphaeraceae archaeon]